jgi:hypothetical protein
MKNKLINRLKDCRAQMRTERKFFGDQFIGAWSKGRWVTLKFQVRWICDMLRTVAMIVLVPSFLLWSL